MVRIYTASQTRHAAMWRDARTKWPGVELTARWPDYVLDGVEETEGNARWFWQHNFDDVRRSDVVIVYAAPGDLLRGALVEAGAAVALGKPVYIVGMSASFGTWQYHPLVTWCPDIASAIRSAKFYSAVAL